MAEYFYNFCFPEGSKSFVNHGFYYLSHKDDSTYSHTEFQTPEGPYRNIFNLKIKEDQVLAYKHNDGDWIKVKENHYPTSAYPLLLPKVSDKAYSYLCISEDSDELMGEVVLTRQGNEIIESLDSKIMRSFVIDTAGAELNSYPDVPKSIDWGGPKSFLCSNEAEAVKGTTFRIDSTILQH